MIQFITRNQLDVKKYDTCIANAINSRIYAYSWYLDSVCDDWGVLVESDYKTVMPLPKRRKYFINYVYTPFWVIQLGIFTASKMNDLNMTNNFLERLKKTFKHIDLRMNTGNYNDNFKNNYIQEKFIHELSLDIEYQQLYKNYKKDRKKNLKKAAHYELREVWDASTQDLIKLYRNNVGLRTPNVKENDYKNLEKLLEKSIAKNVGEVIAIYDKNNDLTASAFLLKNKNRITILISSTDFKNRNNGANTFLIDRAIKKYCNQNIIFDFGGSSIPTIASFFESFGASKKTYFHYSKHLLF